MRRPPQHGGASRPTSTQSGIYPDHPESGTGDSARQSVLLSDTLNTILSDKSAYLTGSAFSITPFDFPLRINCLPSSMQSSRSERQKTPDLKLWNASQQSNAQSSGWKNRALPDCLPNVPQSVSPQGSTQPPRTAPSGKVAEMRRVPTQVSHMKSIAISTRT